MSANTTAAELAMRADAVTPPVMKLLVKRCIAILH